jgi:hypothetical protein
MFYTHNSQYGLSGSSKGAKAKSGGAHGTKCSEFL